MQQGCPTGGHCDLPSACREGQSLSAAARVAHAAQPAAYGHPCPVSRVGLGSACRERPLGSELLLASASSAPAQSAASHFSPTPCLPPRSGRPRPDLHRAEPVGRQRHTETHRRVLRLACKSRLPGITPKASSRTRWHRHRVPSNLRAQTVPSEGRGEATAESTEMWRWRWRYARREKERERSERVGQERAR